MESVDNGILSHERDEWELKSRREESGIVRIEARVDVKLLNSMFNYHKTHCQIVWHDETKNNDVRY